jgi:hypothetical protein
VANSPISQSCSPFPHPRPGRQVPLLYGGRPGSQHPPAAPSRCPSWRTSAIHHTPLLYLLACGVCPSGGTDDGRGPVTGAARTIWTPKRPHHPPLDTAPHRADVEDPAGTLLPMHLPKACAVHHNPRRASAHAQKENAAVITPRPALGTFLCRHMAFLLRP